MALSKVALIQPLQANLGTAVDTIVVGNERKEFTIHRTLLWATAPLFKDYIKEGRSSLLSAWTNHDDKIRQESDGTWHGYVSLVLPQEDPLLFRFFRDWLYSGCIPNNVTCYLKVGDHCAKDEFWWRVLKFGERSQVDRLIALAGKELEILFSENEPSIPSCAFVKSVFDERSRYLDCWKEYIIRHAAFWLEHSANREVWSRFLVSHEEVGPALAAALVRNEIRHPQQLFPCSTYCSDKCSHFLAMGYLEEAADEANQSQNDCVADLIRAQLITDDPTEPSQNEADGDRGAGWGFDRFNQPSIYCCGSRADGWDCSCTTDPVVPTPSQSTIPESPTEAPTSCPSQRAPSPPPISPEHGQDVNTKQPQDMVKEFGGSNHADLVAKFSAWLLSEASGHNGTKSHDNQQTASTSKHGENVALNDVSASRGGIDTPSYCYCPACTFCAVDPKTERCHHCGYVLHREDYLGLSEPPQTMQRHIQARSNRANRTPGPPRWDPERWVKIQDNAADKHATVENYSWNDEGGDWQNTGSQVSTGAGWDYE
ncbi:hypothetical protein EDD36DRAFT_415589 [Exophiala viscosa]|uniref:BTB domain-containing protein n=1 Tax=Exophiala viscosa TaxID=2486360 RepID=A0AAN6IIP3_9EURO|nr:hypothetical protein EDD36DRAFT_415589 [Exophiala viscosa]